MGPTKTFRSQYEAPTSIRGSFGLTDTRNSTHGSGNNSIVMISFKMKSFRFSL